jgi:nicotinamide mononucleotide adenylyltransferase
MFKNPEKAGMDRKKSFQGKSYIFSPHEMFQNSGSGCVAILIYRRIWFRTLQLWRSSLPSQFCPGLEKSDHGALWQAWARILKHLMEAAKSTFRDPSFQRSECTAGLILQQFELCFY